MECFRLSHAGLIVEEGGSALIIDPGDFSGEHELGAALAAAPPVAGLVITHEHADHWTLRNVTAVQEHASHREALPIFTTASTAAALTEAGFGDVTVVGAGDSAIAGDFALEFYGGRHEILHRSIPGIDNVGVRVNGSLAWGGDSLVRPDFTAELLGVPIGSPWSNIAQVMDFVLDAAPRRAYLTHDGMLSDRGRALYTQRVAWCLAQTGGELVELPRADQR